MSQPHPQEQQASLFLQEGERWGLSETTVMMPRTVTLAAEQISAWATMPTMKSSRHGWLPGLGKQGEESQPEELVTMTTLHED